MKKLIIYGANGHAKVIASAFLNGAKDNEILFLDDDQHKVECLGRKIDHNTQNISMYKAPFIIGVGDNKIRKKIHNQISEYCEFSNFVAHPASWISNYSEIGKGTVFMANSVINAGAKIGKHCIINTAAIIEHDCEIDNYVHIAPGAALAGGVRVGEGSHIGIGSSVIQNVSIGKWCIIGAGAVIINDVPDFSVVVGNPGRIIKTLK